MFVESVGPFARPEGEQVLDSTDNALRIVTQEFVLVELDELETIHHLGYLGIEAFVVAADQLFVSLEEEIDRVSDLWHESFSPCHSLEGLADDVTLFLSSRILQQTLKANKLLASTAISFAVLAVSGVAALTYVVGTILFTPCAHLT